MTLTLQRIRDYAPRYGSPIEIVVVDDGSRDDTADQVRAFDPGSLTLRLLQHSPNRGKGYAVRRGMLEASGDVLLFSDADLSTPIEEIEKLLPPLQHGYDIAIASRAMPDSHVNPPRPPLRRFMHRVFRFLRGLILLPDIEDTQCGFKAFTRKVGRELFQRQTLDGYAFDCEVLALARRRGYRIKEVGVVWVEDHRSSIRPFRDGSKMLLSLLNIRFRLHHIWPQQED